MTDTGNRAPNRLIYEKSPYLLQHAYNPVDWYPWGDEAFAKAAAEDKPVFLSIGYSTCHWCHVMAHECFEDEEIAEILNKHYVSVKVDREERPDVDHIYMSVCQSITGHGGWPLTLIMTPDKVPFFAGTYFPKYAQGGMPGLMDILQAVQQKWHKDKRSLTAIAQQIKQALQELEQPQPDKFNADIVHTAYRQLKNSFDAAYGGFGHAPKFPSAHNLLFLMRYYKLHQEKTALDMVEKTLEGMYRGGIYDHIGFGFSRYSVDHQWLVPHFEKMLYDNAMLAMTYLEAYQITKTKLYREVAEGIFDYVLRDMTAPEGGFYSAEDADSEGEEGKFYLWTPEEVIKVLGEKEGNEYCRLYNITSQGNFAGKSIPNLIKTDLVADELEILKQKCRPKLFEYRQKRIHPGKDDKILTAWNGLMIAAFAKGAQVLQEPRYLNAAVKGAAFINNNLRTKTGRLLARYRDGEAAYLAYLDDYAFIIWGLLELYNATFDYQYLERALSLNADMIDLFWDQKQSGFFFYGRDQEQLIARPKEVYDGAIPSGNSVAAYNLIRLARLTGDKMLEEYSEKQLNAFSGDIRLHPRGYTFFITAGLLFLQSPLEIVIVGDEKNPETKQMIKAAQTKFLPEATLLYRPNSGNYPDLPLLKGRNAVKGKSTAYICKNFACQEPIIDVHKFEAALT